MKAFTIPVLMLLGACAASGPAVPEQLSVIELARGQHARAAEHQSFELVTSQQQLDMAWQRIGEASPTVDFTGFSVIVLHMGRQRSGGHAITVDSITRVGATLRVVVRLRVPGEGCMTTMALTSPFQVVLVPAGATHADFVTETEAVACQ